VLIVGAGKKGESRRARKEEQAGGKDMTSVDVL
jgi:hypothetical protein